MTKAYWATTLSFDQYDSVILVVGETAGKAKSDYLKLMGDPFLNFTDVKVRRAKDKDFAFNGEQV